MKKLIFLPLFLLCYIYVFAADSLVVVKNLTLDDCVSMAIDNNVNAKNAELGIEEARQTKKAALTKYFPSVDAMFGAFHSDKSYIELGISDIKNDAARLIAELAYEQYAAPLGIGNSVSFLEKGMAAGVTAMQPVFAGGRIVNGNKLAKLGITAAEYKQELAIDEITLRTEELYWSVKSLEEKRRTVETVLDLLSNLDRDVRVALDAGLVNRNEGLKVKLKINEMEANLIKIDNGVRLTKMALCQHIGAEYSDDIVLTDTLQAVVEPWQIQVANDEAVASRTESKLLDLSVKAEQLQKKMIIGQTLPQIGLGASYSYNNLLEKDRTNLTGFAMVQVPILAWWETGHNIKKQNLKIEEAQNTRNDLRAKLELQTQQVWDELDAAYRSYTLSEQAVNDAKENLDISNDYYKAGLITMSELLESQTLYRQALDSRVERNIEYQMALSRYKQIIANTDK